MHSQRISRHFYLSLLEFVLAARQRIIAVGAEFGLTAIQAITLMLLDDSHPRPMKSYCMQFHCDASNITGIIDGLEKKGLVSRQNDPADRRIKVIQLEKPGKKLQDAILDRLSAENSLLFDSLTEDEMKQFTRVIEKLAIANCANFEQES